ncbi:MAG: septum formation initiator family protein [Blautia sp.]|nr:septum formation initiator family protein [Blautia sp.]
MSASIRREFLLFFLSVGQGCLLHILYDLIRGFRLALSGGKKILAVTDFLYWIFCGFYLFIFTFRTNQGLLRSYLLLGLAAGAFLWNRLFSALFVSIWRKLLSFPIFLVNFFRKRLLFFLERCKILEYQFIRWMLKGKEVRLMVRGERGLETANKGKRKKSIGANHLGMVGVIFVASILLGGLIYESHDLASRLSAYEARAAALDEAIEEEKARTEQIDELKRYMKTDAYAEDVARDRLGLVKENEIIFVEEEN